MAEIASDRAAVVATPGPASAPGSEAVNMSECATVGAVPSPPNRNRARAHPAIPFSGSGTYGTTLSWQATIPPCASPEAFHPFVACTCATRTL